MQPRLAWLFHDLVTLFVPDSIVRLLASQGLELLEGRKAALFAILLFSLTFRLGFDGVHPDAINILIITGFEIPSTAPTAPPR